MPPPDPTQPPWQRLRPLPVIFVIGLFALVWWRGQGAKEQARSRQVDAVQTEAGHTILQGRTMGTTFRVKLAGLIPERHGRAMLAVVQAELDKVDAAMSTYKPTSELSRFNQLPKGGELVFSPETAEVMALALRVGAASGGAFDVTVGPLVEAWGFGPSRPRQDPDAATLTALRARVGASTVLRFDPKTRAIRTLVPGVHLDFSAIAKGYAVDKVAARLQAEGVPGFMVEVGGEIRTHGARADKKPWRIGIEQPNPAGAGLAQVVEVTERALATSGDYRNYRERDGVRLSHTIDPRTGEPITHGLASVSVLAKTCAEADAWATAINVLGPEAGLALAEREGLAAFLLIRRADGTFAGRSSAAWPSPAEK